MVKKSKYNDMCGLSGVNARSYTVNKSWMAKYTLILVLIVFGGCGFSLQSAAQTTGKFLDEGGAIFNVKAYGATGNGTTNDATDINSAISAAVSAGGGIVYFPAGTYLLSAQLTNSRPDIVSLVGSGTGSVLKINTSVGISLESTSGAVHGAGIENLSLSCNSTTYTAVQTTDMAGSSPYLYDLSISNCGTGFDFVNTSLWTERIVAFNITDYYNNHLFHFDQNPADSNNSYGYGTYTGIYVNKNPGQDVFYLTGGAYLYHSTIAVKGNFASPASGASIINVEGSSGDPCPGAALNTYDIAVEGSGYSVVNAANNGCSGGATGNAIVGGTGMISAVGSLASTTSLINNLSALPFLAGILTTTNATSNTLSSSIVYPTSTCYAQPQNSTAASMITGTYVSGVNWGSVTLSHPATAGGTFQIWCQ